MVSQDKLIKQGIYLTDNVFDIIIKRLKKGVKSSDTLEAFINQTRDYTMNNPLVVNEYKDKLISIIVKETNNHRFSRPAQKELVRLTIENRVGDRIVDVGEDIKQSVRDIVKEGYNNNLSQDEIAEEISHRVTSIKNTRARTIARTEIARTATASDYVINKERGATHFTVDCRDTCCGICARDYNWGKIEYTIDQVEMLPPRHPNCRCVANFFIKETLEGSFYDKEDTFVVLPYVQLTEDKLPNIFSDEIKKGFLKFDETIKDAKYEYTYISNLTTGAVGKIYTDNEPDKVNPRTDIEIHAGDELVATHNHRSHMPFNDDDFEVIFSNPAIYVKNLVVHTPTDIFICELDTAALPNKDIVINEIAICYGEALIERGVEDYDTAKLVWDKYKSNKVLNKYMSFRRIRK